MAVVHREDGGAAGMSGRRGQREMSRPRWRRVVRRGASKGRLGAFQRQGTLLVQVEASGTRKRLSGRFHFFLEEKINK